MLVKVSDAVHAVGLDVGGTSVSVAVVAGSGEIRARWECKIDSDGNADGIVGTICTAVRYGLHAASERGTMVVGIGVGMPGPFDYEAGVHRARHKFGAIAGLPLRPEIRKNVEGSDNVPIRFLHDIHAFLLGEYWMGIARIYDRVMTINIGTGLGVGYVRLGELLHDGSGGPWRSIYARPYGDGILEDYVSRRGIIRRYQSMLGASVNQPVSHGIDVHDIAARARNGDVLARSVFDETGRMLAHAVTPITTEFRPECIIFCGKISLAFDLFGESFRQALPRDPAPPYVVRSEDPTTSALLGAAYNILAQHTDASEDQRGLSLNAPQRQR